MSWKSWAIVARNDAALNKALTVEGVIDGSKGGVPIFHGTLDEWANRWNDWYVAHDDGRWIEIT